MNTPYAHRLAALRQQSLAAGLDGLLISKKEHLFYLTGLKQLTNNEREAFLFMTPRETILYHSPFIAPPHFLTTVPMTHLVPLTQIIPHYFGQIAVLGIEKQNLTVIELERLQAMLPTTSFDSIDLLIQTLRIQKSIGEIRAITTACQLTNQVMNKGIDLLKNGFFLGRTEQDVANWITHQLFDVNANLAFPTIVAFDEHSAQPHHIPGTRKLTSASVVLIDMGAQWHGYLSDMTRTICLAASPSSEFLNIEKVVLDAYRSAARSHRSSGSDLTAADIDTAARSVVNTAGYGDRFIHTTGHGIGLEPHEAPSVSASNTNSLLINSVITIEPGIYLPRRFGYRHEDTFRFNGQKLISLTS